MLRLTPRLVRRKVLPVSYLVFLTSMLISGTIFYKGKPFYPKAAILSDLQSPDENPDGYGVAAVGTALFAILLAPATRVFYNCLQKNILSYRWLAP
jgi:hypothetical protein